MALTAANSDRLSCHDSPPTVPKRVLSLLPPVDGLGKESVEEEGLPEDEGMLLLSIGVGPGLLPPTGGGRPPATAAALTLLEDGSGDDATAAAVGVSDVSACCW